MSRVRRSYWVYLVVVAASLIEYTLPPPAVLFDMMLLFDDESIEIVGEPVNTLPVRILLLEFEASVMAPFVLLFANVLSVVPERVIPFERVLPDKIME